MLLVALWTGAATVENSMDVSQKAKTRTNNDPAISLLVIYPPPPQKKPQKTDLKTNMHPNVYNSIIYKCWDMNAT